MKRTISVLFFLLLLFPTKRRSQVSWDFSGFTTDIQEVVLSATITLLDGSVDPAVSMATLVTESQSVSVAVDNGLVSANTRF